MWKTLRLIFGFSSKVEFVLTLPILDEGNREIQVSQLGGTNRQHCHYLLLADAKRRAANCAKSRVHCLEQYYVLGTTHHARHAKEQ